MTKNIFCFFLLLLPLFFIPQKFISQELLATAFLVVFALSLLFFNFFKIIKLKKISFNFNNIFKISFLLFFSLFLSFIFSKNLSLSFFGGTGESFLALTSILIIFYFSKLIEKKEILLNYFILGNFVSSIIFLINHNLFYIPSLSIVLSISLITLIYNLFKNNNYKSFKFIIWGLMLIPIFISLLMIDIKISWFILSLGSFFIFWKLIIDNNLKDKKVIISCFILLLSLSLFFIEKPWSEEIKENRLSYSESLSIAGKSLIENPKNLILGSGLGNYSYQFSLHKGEDFNDSNLIFNQGANSFLTFIVTMGLLGSFSLLFLIFYFYFKGFKELFKKDDFIFPIAFCFSLTLFFYRIDLLIILLFFIFLGLFDEEKKEKEINIIFFKSLYSLFLILLLLSSFYFYNYIKADYYYNKSINDFKNNVAMSKVIIEIEKSEKLFSKSDYDVSLSKLYLIKASDYFKERWITKEKKEEQKKLIEENILKAEYFAQKASQIDYNNFLVWQNLGLLYENANYLIGDKYDEAISSYEKAKELAPNNYSIYFALGRIFENKGEKEKAFDYYSKAFELNNSDQDLKNKIDSYE